MKTTPAPPAKMADTLDVVIEDDRWQAVDLPAICRRAADQITTHLGVPIALFEMSVLACNDTHIAELNADFRGKSQPTNVLSWPAFELAADTDGARPQPVPDRTDFDDSLGDIAISYDTCAREAAAAGLSLTDHVTHLMLHGILHLLGYDHIRDADATLMERNEVQMLAKLGIANPY